MDQDINEQLRAEIIDDLGLNDLSSIEQEAIISDLEAKIIEQVNSIILDRLDEEEKEELATITDDEEIASFLRRAISDLDEVKKEASLWVVKNWRTEREKNLPET